MNSSCLNCQLPLTEGHLHCPQCGQKTSAKRIILKDVLHDAMHAFTHADKGFFMLLKELALRPGTVAKNYVEGQRKKYFNPVSFFFITVGLYVLVASSFHVLALPDQKSSMDAMYEKETDPVKRQRLAAFIERQNNYMHFMERHTNVVSMVTTPILALILFWLMKKRGRNYAEVLVAVLYAISFGILVNILFFIPVIKILNSDKAFLYMNSLFFLFTMIYYMVSFHGFFNYEPGKGYVRVFFSTLLSFLVAVSMVSIVAVFYMMGFFS